MTIKEYLAHFNMRPSTLAQKLGASPSTVTRWRDGVTRPTVDMMLKLERVTDGKVKLKDFAA